MKLFIDRYNILKATLIAMKTAVTKQSQTRFRIVDAVKIPEITIQQKSIIRGDKICACIAAASIIAKVERDKIMRLMTGFIHNMVFVAIKVMVLKNI